MKLSTTAVVLAVMLAMACVAVAQDAGSGSVRSARRTASIAGRIINSDGSAADGARVVVYAIRDGAAAAIVGTATSSYDGRYEVTGLPAGRFLVGVTPQKASGYGGDLKRPPAFRVETLYPGVTDRDEAQPITVFEGVPTEGIDVWLAPAPQRFTISGRVFWPNGTSVSNLAIEYSDSDAVRHGVWYVDDPGGLFTIEGVAQGTYVLLAYADSRAGRLMGIVSTDISLGSVEDVRVLLRSPGAIDGRVVFEGQPPKPAPADVRVSPTQMLLTLSPLYPADEAVVGSGGRFSIGNLLGQYTFTIHGLPPGWKLRRVTRNGVAQPDNRITVAAGERIKDVELVVGAGST